MNVYAFISRRRASAFCVQPPFRPVTRPHGRSRWVRCAQSPYLGVRAVLPCALSARRKVETS